jgi:hypothetical protein
LDDLCRQVETECGRWIGLRCYLDPEKYNAGIINLFKSGKVEVLMDEGIDYNMYTASLRKLRFFGKTQDQFINVIVSQVWSPTVIGLVCNDQIEVDPASPAIKEFKSLQEVLHSKRDLSTGYPSLLVFKSRKKIEGKCYCEKNPYML